MSQKTRDVSQRELQRSLQANNQFTRAVSSTELERLQMMVDQADLSEEEARFDLCIANASYESKLAVANTIEFKVRLHQIVSPINGMVVARQTRTGEWLDAGQAFARIVQLDVLRVEANIDGTANGEELLNREIVFSTQYETKPQHYKGKKDCLRVTRSRSRRWDDTDLGRGKECEEGMQGTLRIPTDITPVATSRN